MTSPYPDPKRDKSCWVAWYYEDFRAGTAEMSFGAKGLYVTMLNHQWSHGSIPNPGRELKTFCRALGCLPEDFVEFWPEVAGRFVEDESGRLVNGRAQRESEARGKKREQTIEAIRKRWSNTSEDTHEHTNVSSPVSTEPDTKPDTEPHTSPSPSPSPSPSLPEGDISPSSKAHPAEPGPLTKEFLAAWNSLPPVFPRIQALTGKRRTALKARMGDPRWRSQWRTALDQMKTMPFCTGDNDRGWVGNPDWFLRPDTVTKIVEGQYGGNGKPAAKATPKYTSDTGPKERSLKEREKQLREELPDEAATAAMLAMLAEKFPTQRT